MAERPVLEHGFLGPQSKFDESGLSTVSHHSPEVDFDTNEALVQIRFSKPVKVTATLTNTRSNEEQLQHVFMQTNGDTISFVVSLPETGYYKLQLFALLLPDESKTLPGVYNYLLNCKNVTTPAVSYPKQFAQWKEGCYIVEPVTLTNVRNLANVRFEAHTPNAKQMAVVSAGEWTHLRQNSAGLWEGRVNLEKTRDKDSVVTLNVNYGKDNKFSTLLEYKL